MDRETLYAFATEVRTLVAMLAKTSSLALDRRLSEAKPRVSGLQYSILRALSSEPMTIAELSRTFSRNPSTLVPAIDSLERKTLVQRGEDPDDRRRIPVCLTLCGRRLLDDVPYVHESDPAVLGLQAMGEEQMERLLALLCAWAAHLPEGQELVRKVEAEVYMHVQTLGKEVSRQENRYQKACRYCWAPDGFEPCPRRRTTDG